MVLVKSAVVTLQLSVAGFSESRLAVVVVVTLQLSMAEFPESRLVVVEVTLQLSVAEFSESRLAVVVVTSQRGRIFRIKGGGGGKSSNITA